MDAHRRDSFIVTGISDALQWAVEEGSMNESPAPDENLPPDGGGTPQGSEPAASDPDAGGDGSHHRSPESLFSIESVIARLGETLGMAPDIHLQDVQGEVAPEAPSPPDKPLSGAVGRYRFRGEIARGGIGVVYRVHDVDIGRDLALKVLHESLAGPRRCRTG